MRSKPIVGVTDGKAYGEASANGEEGRETVRLRDKVVAILGKATVARRRAAPARLAAWIVREQRRSETTTFRDLHRGALIV